MDDRAAGRAVLNGPERVLYGRLMRAFPGHVILAQVALSRLVALDGRGAVRNAVVAFVVCRPDFTALAAIELEGPAARRGRGARGDPPQDRLLRAAGIKVIRLPAEDIPPEPALRALVSTLPLDPSAPHLMRRAS